MLLHDWVFGLGRAGGGGGRGAGGGRGSEISVET